VARPPRIDYKGAFYHVTFPGNERRKVLFGKAEDAKKEGRPSERVCLFPRADPILSFNGHLYGIVGSCFIFDNRRVRRHPITPLAADRR
jgi:hypothetical protein